MTARPCGWPTDASSRSSHRSFLWAATSSSTGRTGRTARRRPRRARTKLRCWQPAVAGCWSTTGDSRSGALKAARALEARPVEWWIGPTLPVLAAALAFAWYLHGELQRLYGLTGSAWDLEYDQQVIWNVSAGQGFYSSFARAAFLGIHFELIFVVLAAVERLWPNPAVLLIFSSAGLAATAPAAYLFFRALLPGVRDESPRVCGAMSAPYPFWALINVTERVLLYTCYIAI